MRQDQDILNCIDKRVGLVLSAANIGMTGESFEAFRKFMLDQMGWKGLKDDLKNLGCLIDSQDGEERQRMGRSKSGMKGG